jgi:hypothetical protein
VVSIPKPKQSRIELGSRHFEAGDSGGIGFKSQANQLVKQRDVFHEVAILRFFDGGFGLGDRMPYAPFLNFGFHIPDRSEVLVQLVPIPAVEPLAKVTRTLKIGVQNGLLEMELIEQAFLIFGFVGDEELAKKITGTFDWWNAHPGSGPRHLAPPVQSVFRADDQGREAGLASDRFGGSLVKRKVSGRHGRCLGLFDSGKKGMNGIVPAFHSMIQMGKDRQLIEMPLDRHKGLGQRLDEPGSLGEKVRGVKTK